MESMQLIDAAGAICSQVGFGTLHIFGISSSSRLEAELACAGHRKAARLRCICALVRQYSAECNRLDPLLDVHSEYADSEDRLAAELVWLLPPEDDAITTMGSHAGAFGN